jgi:hypothetical protein
MKRSKNSVTLPDGIFINTFEDMDWLWDTHLKNFKTLRLYYKSAILTGNEDCPTRIDLFKRVDPHYMELPLVFLLNAEDLSYIKQ